MAEYIELETLMKFPIRRDHCDKEHANEHFINGIETVMEYAENLPAADVEPVRHGDWDVILDDWEDTVTLRCPLCGEEYAVDCDDDEIPQAKYSYCPGCGAKMDGGADNG